EHIKQVKPDYICIPGDITDKSYIKDEKYFIDWLKKLSKICKVIISIGNHEFYIDKHKDIYGLNKLLINKISNINNLYLLDNKKVIIDNINFIGLTIPIEYYKETYKSDDFSKYVDKLKTYKKYYNILLCHSPLNISNSNILKDRNINLILCGHMHGGVVPKFMRNIFKNKGLISPNKRLFPKVAYGYLKVEKTDIIISSGIRVTPFKFINKFFKPEIVKINI
ncbi:MAG: metallophosphoesterase, partial [Bacilli bacterium]|nr:metallophosphoesterase [Bacilli bacterium]